MPHHQSSFGCVFLFFTGGLCLSMSPQPAPENFLPPGLEADLIKESPDEFETGLDHLDPLHYSITAENHPELKEILQDSQSNDMTLVQQFIRGVKGLPLEWETDVPLIGGHGPEAAKPQWCTLPYELKKLVEVEVEMYPILNSFHSDYSSLHDLMDLDSYLRDMRRSTLKAMMNVELLDKYSRFEDNVTDPFLFVATHPVLMYRMIRRFAEDLQPIFYEIQLIDPEVFGKLENTNPEHLVFPTETDLDDAWDAIARIQIQTRVPTFEIARGILEHVDTEIHITALQALELGAHHCNIKLFDSALEWLYFAQETAKKRRHPLKHSLIDEFIQEMLTLTVKAHNEYFPQGFHQKWGPAVFNTTVSLPFNPTPYGKRYYEFDMEATQNRSMTHWNPAIKANFDRLCAGETLLTEAEKAALMCHYSTSRNLYWRINPLKVEILHVNPPVYLFHDFLGDQLIKKMKHYAVPIMERSKVVDRTTGLSKYEHTRTSSQAWMYDQDFDYLQTLTENLEALAQITIKPKIAHDAYQIACYGPSHHYEAHHDSFENFQIVSPDKGNRIVTIMGYLADTAVGGRTAFPVLGIYTRPVKGSLVMWYNTKKNGEVRCDEMWHGGCPVILGLKWITNKWVYYYENFKHYPCSLNEHE